MTDMETCKEIHRRIDEKMETQERRLNRHAERLDLIENINSRLEERISNLINQLNSLNIILRWFMGLLIGAFVTFFFVAAQRGLL